MVTFLLPLVLKMTMLQRRFNLWNLKVKELKFLHLCLPTVYQYCPRTQFETYFSSLNVSNVYFFLLCFKILLDLLHFKHIIWTLLNNNIIKEHTATCEWLHSFTFLRSEIGVLQPNITYLKRVNGKF